MKKKATMAAMKYQWHRVVTAAIWKVVMNVEAVVMLMKKAKGRDLVEAKACAGGVNRGGWR